MQKNIVVFFLLLLSTNFFGQEVILPEDFRQHSLTQFNASLFNPTFSIDRNNPRSLSLWTRWQWQNIDDNPTTTFLNYTHSINDRTVFGVGFLQHNTGTFLNTGGLLNIAHAISLKENVSLVVGANINLFQQEFANSELLSTSPLLELETSTDFIGQFLPGVRLNVNNFTIAASLENFLNYNFSQSDINNDGIIYSGSISNDFPVSLFPFAENNFIRPVVYVKSIPNIDTQYGANVLLSTSKFWVQWGYNSFYGASGGIGGTFSDAFSIGAHVELGTDTAIQNEDPTFEIIASYHFGKASRKKEIAPKLKEDPEVETVTEELESEEPIKESEPVSVKKKKTKKTKREERKRLKAQKDSIQLAEVETQRQLLQVKAKEAEDKLAQEETQRKQLEAQQEKDKILEQEKARLDSIAKLEQAKEVTVLPNEKYEEVTSGTIDGLEPGFYLIANVFGTKKYFDAFMKSTRERGLNPKSFYRPKNKYNYVYLGEYRSIEEARKARNSKLNGKYKDKMWIFRVR